jgi:hypothetical protein
VTAEAAQRRGRQILATSSCPFRRRRRQLRQRCWQSSKVVRGRLVANRGPSKRKHGLQHAPSPSSPAYGVKAPL